MESSLLQQTHLALRGDPHVLERIGALPVAQLLQLFGDAVHNNFGDVQLFVASVLLRAGQRGALPDAAWPPLLALAPRAAPGAAAQVARAVAAAAHGSSKAADLAAAAGADLALWRALATECPRNEVPDAATVALAARALDACASRAEREPGAALAAAARWLETGACLRSGAGAGAGACPVARLRCALPRCCADALARGDADAAAEFAEACANHGGVKPGDAEALDVLAAAGCVAPTDDVSRRRAVARVAAAVARTAAVDCGRAARPPFDGLLDAVARSCASRDAAVAEAALGAWVVLLTCGGGAKRVAERRPRLHAAAAALAPELVARCAWPRGGCADLADHADADDFDAAPELHGDDAAPLPGGAGAWDEPPDFGAFRRLRGAFLGDALRASADALGAPAYVAAVAAAAAALGPAEPDVLEACARAAAFAGPAVAQAAKDDATTAGALRSLLAACAAVLAAHAGPRAWRVAAAAATLAGALARWLCGDPDALDGALGCLALSLRRGYAPGHACRAARTLLCRASAPAALRGPRGADVAAVVDARAAELAASPTRRLAAAAVDALFRGLGAAALAKRDGVDDAGRAARAAALAAGPAVDWRAPADAARVAAVAREAARHCARPAEAAVAAAALDRGLAAAWRARAPGDDAAALEAVVAALAAASSPSVVAAALDLVAASPRCDAPALRLVADVVERWGARAERSRLPEPPPEPDAAPLFDRVAGALPAVVAAALAAPDADDEAAEALLVLGARAVAACPLCLEPALVALAGAAAAGLGAHREALRVAVAACDFVAGLGALAERGAETMAPEDAWRDPDEPGEDFAAARRARLRPALAAAFAAHGPRLVERALAPALAGEPPLLGRDRAAAVLALHALAPGDVAAAARAVCAATRPDLADAVAAALDEAGREGRGATRALVAVFAKAAASS